MNLLIQIICNMIYKACLIIPVTYEDMINEIKTTFLIKSERIIVTVLLKGTYKFHSQLHFL